MSLATVEAEYEAAANALELRKAAKETKSAKAAEVLRWHAIEIMRPFARKVMKSYAVSVKDTITCRDCRGELFIDNGRSLDYNNWICAGCGSESQTLTESGMSR